VAGWYHFVGMDAKRIRLAAGALALALIAVVVVASSGSDDAQPPATTTPTGPQTEPRALTGYSNIYVVDVKSRNVEPLTKNSDEELAQGPSWAPAARIAFTEAPDDESLARLFLIDSKGSIKRVPTRLSHVFQPSWAPDERRIAVSKLGGGIYSIDVRDGSTRRLSARESDEAPAWSPDGRRILFQRQVTASNWDIYQIDPAGNHLRRLTPGPLQQTNPSWSPDGERIAFAEQQKSGNWAIYTIKSDGSGRARVTDEQVSSQEPSWSPDGDRIAFILQEGAEASVVVMDADGGQRRRLTGSSLVASRPAWSPDGSKIVFSAKTISRSGEGH
jgi:TolB protein